MFSNTKITTFVPYKPPAIYVITLKRMKIIKRNPKTGKAQFYEVYH